MTAEPGKVEIITSDQLYKSPHNSQAVRLGNLVITSGRTGMDRNGRMVGLGDPGAQTEQAFENLRLTLEAAGSGMDLIGKLTVITTDLSFKPAIDEVRQRIFGELGYLPASTFMVVTSLPTPDILVAIDAIAVVR